jgi:hypothetical protein
VGHKKHFKALSVVHFSILKHYFSYSPATELKGSALLIPKPVKLHKSDSIKSSFIWIVTWVMAPYSLVGRQEHFAGTHCILCKSCSQITSTLKMEAVCSSETLVPIYQTSWCHNSDDHNMNLHSMKTSNRTNMVFIL